MRGIDRLPCAQVAHPYRVTLPPSTTSLPRPPPPSRGPPLLSLHPTSHPASEGRGLGPSLQVSNWRPSNSKSLSFFPRTPASHCAKGERGRRESHLSL